MRFSLAHDVVTYLFAGLGLVALYLGGAFSPAFALLVAALIGASVFARGEQIVKKRYSDLVTASVALLLLVQILRAIFSEPFLPMAIEFAALLQVSRLAHRRTAADYKQIAGLSILHLIAATVITRDLGYAALFAGYVVATPWMFGLTQVREALERQYRDPARGEHEVDPRLEEVLARPGWVGPGFFVGTAALSLALVAVTITFFLAFPRVSGDFLGLRGGAGGAVTGFGEDVSLGGFGTIRTDRRVVVRVFAEPGGDSPLLPLVLRGTSFDDYEGGRWSRSELPPERSFLSREPLVLTRSREPRRGRRLTLLSELAGEPVLFIPEGSERVVRARAGAGALVDEVEHRPGVDVRAIGLEGTARRYSIVLGDDLDLREPPQLERYLTLPAEMGRLAALAREIVGPETRPRAMAEALERHLTSGAYEYTLEQVSVEGVDPVEHFLFERRAGHCEYFSTAMVLMLRSLGVPARNVTGFVGGRFNEYGGYYAIQQGDAHSWVEAYVDGRFVRFDPTPAARESFGIDEGLVTRLQAFVDSLRMHWYDHVVGYDREDQLRLLLALRAFRRAGGGFDASGGDPEEALSFAPRWSGWIVVGLALAVALGLLVARGAGRERAGREAEEVRLLRAIEARAARRGAARPETETPLEWARRLEGEGFVAAADVTRAVRAFAAVRYEGADERETQLAIMREALRSLERAPQGANWKK